MSSENKVLNITAVKVIPFDTRATGGKTVAFAEVEIAGALLIKGIRILESGARGLFLGFPSQRARRDTFVDLVVPLTAEARRELREAVIDEYKEMTGWQPKEEEEEGP